MQTDNPNNEKRTNRQWDSSFHEPEIPTVQWYRMKSGGMITGVCAGLAVITGVPVEIIRLAFVVATLMGFGGGILIYVALWLIMPQLPPGKVVQTGPSLLDRVRRWHGPRYERHRVNPRHVHPNNPAPPADGSSSSEFKDQGGGI